MMNQHEEDKKQTGSEPASEINVDGNQAQSTSDASPQPDQSDAQAEGEQVQASDVEAVAEDINQELAAAREEVAKLKDAYLRAKAEEDNVRRRTEKEVANSRKFAIEGFAKEMLQVRDSLKLACSVEIADDADAAVKSIHEGVELTLKQLDAGLSKFSLVEIAPEVGDKLDPNLHQAMSIVESEEVDSGCILTIIQVGFQLHDRLLRPAMVVVAK